MKISRGPIGQLKSYSQEPISIIGAGVSGLVMGHYLKKADIPFMIYEKNSHAGGKINTIYTDYGPAETAANAIFTNDDVLDLIDELNLNYQSAPKLKKYVWRDNTPQSPPFKIKELILILFRSFKKIDKENIEKKSIYDFFSPLMGKYLTAQVMSAALGGIYAENTKKIHFKSLFKTPFKAKRYFSFFIELMKMKKKRSKKPAQSISFDKGMKEFINALEDELKEHITYNHTIDELPQNCIICTEAFNSALLLEDCAPKLSGLLNKIHYNHMFSSTVFSSRPIDFLKDGFGVVFTPEHQLTTLGILSNNSIFTQRSKQSDIYSYTFMNKGQEDIKETLSREINQLFGEKFFQSILYIQTTPWPKAIPIYDYNRYEIIKKLRVEINNYQGIVLFGNYIDGVAIREMITMAKDFVTNIRLNDKSSQNL